MTGHPLFDTTAAGFARAADGLIAAGRYRRGEVFRAALTARLEPGARILDYGCGPGRLAHYLARQGYVVDGVDPSEGMIREALALPRAGAEARFRVLAGPDAGIALNYYDGIVCSSVIEYVPDDVSLLRRLRSWLRPGGFAFVSFANRHSLWRAYARVRYGAKAAHYDVQHHVETAASIRGKAADAGLTPDGTIIYFESPLDRWPALVPAAGSRWVGTLGLLALRREEGAVVPVS